MKVAVDQIGAQGLALTERVTDAPWLHATLADAGGFVAPQGAMVALRLTRELQQVRVRGDVQLQMRGPCSRCAEDIGFALATPIDVALVPLEAQPKALPSGEVRAQDIDLGAYVDDVVDVGSILHDEILLDMPSQVLCQEDCAGRCANCGRNRNVEDCRCDEAVNPLSPFARLAQLKQP